MTQQVLSGDLLGALTTIETALVGSLVAIGQPTLDAIIESRQRYLAVRQALQVAVPQAFFSVVGGVGQNIDGVLRAFITAGKDLVAVGAVAETRQHRLQRRGDGRPGSSRKTAMVAVNPPTDTADAPDTDTAAVSLAATSDEKAVSSEKQTPKADADEGRSATKDAESATSGKPDDPNPKSPKHDTEKKQADSPKQEPRRPTTSQRPKAPKKVTLSVGA